MRKLLLAVLAAAPLVAGAQGTGENYLNRPTPTIGTTVVGPIGKVESSKKEDNGMMSFIVGATPVGTTIYDLQTNGSMPRRILLHDNGEVSIIWTSSKEDKPNFADRGTAYVHGEGDNFTEQNQSRYEPDRAGFGGIAVIKENGVEKEIIVSHYASSSTTGATGGMYLMKNSGIGNTDFTLWKTILQPGGPLWPRVCVSGDGRYVHIIATYTVQTGESDTVRLGVVRPTVYFRLDVDADQWLDFDKMLPGYDSTRYTYGGADDYAVDAQNNSVVIALGGSTVDMAYWKSMDNGENWRRVVVEEHPYAGKIGEVAEVEGVEVNNGSISVLLDDSDSVHIAYGITLYTVPEANDSGASFYSQGYAIIRYWNENFPSIPSQTALDIGYWIDYNGSGTIDVHSSHFEETTTSQEPTASYGSTLTLHPSLSIDEAGNLFMIYDMPVETDLYPLSGAESLRDIYVAALPAGTGQFLAPQNLNKGEGTEDVYGSAARRGDDRLHFIWSSDAIPGPYAPYEGDPTSVTTIYYAAVSSDLIINGVLGTDFVGVRYPESTQFNDVNIYPNPANDLLNISMSLKKATVVQVEVLSTSGQSLLKKSFGDLRSGAYVQTVDISTVPPGLHFIRLYTGKEYLTLPLSVN